MFIYLFIFCGTSYTVPLPVFAVREEIFYSTHTEVLAVYPPRLLPDVFCSSPPAETKMHMTFTTTETMLTSSDPSHIFTGVLPLDFDSLTESKKYKQTLNKNLKVTSSKISSSSNSSDCRKRAENKK